MVDPKPLLPDPAEGIEIDPSTVAALMEGRATDDLPFRLIDCREEDEFQFCRLPAAELIPLGEIPQKLAGLIGDTEVAEQRPLVIY